MGLLRAFRHFRPRFRVERRSGRQGAVAVGMWGGRGLARLDGPFTFHPESSDFRYLHPHVRHGY